MIKLMVKAHTDMQMARLISAIGSKTSSMAKVWRLGLTVLDMKEDTKMVKRMAKEF